MFSALSSSFVNSDDAEEEGGRDCFEPTSRTYALDWTEDSSLHPSEDELTFSTSSASSSSSSLASDHEGPRRPPNPNKYAIIEEILSQDDLYDILGVSRKSALDKHALRRAYLSRSKACHPDKFPGNADATQAFQKVNVAYDILSTPSSKRCYDAKPTRTAADFFAARSFNHAEDTFRDVVLGVFNDFLEGDLETVRVLLRAMNDLNPSLSLRDEGIDMILRSLHSIRDRALTCRACVLALHTEVSRLIEVQHAFRQLSYFDVRKRFRLTLELTRITVSLPIALEQAIQQQKAQSAEEQQANAVLNARVRAILQGSALVLARLERFLS